MSGEPTLAQRNPAKLVSCKIRQSTLIEGIKLPLTVYGRNEVRISTFADDTTICINHSKSDAIWIGSLKQRF